MFYILGDFVVVIHVIIITFVRILLGWQFFGSVGNNSALSNVSAMQTKNFDEGFNYQVTFKNI